jgi:hypothetical protein
MREPVKRMSGRTNRQRGIPIEPREIEDMTTTTDTNGRARKSLAEQIDRLDGILDGLADGLNEAVAAAVKEAVTLAVRQAVQSVVSELVTNPAVLEMLKRTLVQPQATAASATSAPSPAPQSGLKRCLIGAWNGTKSLFRKAGCGLAVLWQRLKLVRHIKAPLLLAVGVGTVSGFAAYFAGPWMAAGLGWLGGFAATLAVQAWSTFSRLLAPAPATCQ